MSFLVFLSQTSADKAALEEMGRRVAQREVHAWLRKSRLIPGDPLQPATEDAQPESAPLAVFAGPAGFATWQNDEMRAAIDRRCRNWLVRGIPGVAPGPKVIILRSLCASPTICCLSRIPVNS
jgi:hypothetical protein